MEKKKLVDKPNIIMIISDQQTWIQNWDSGWALENLPAMRRLQKNGLTFNRAHCNSCTCSPSRTTLFTGMYPAHHKVMEVLGFDNPDSMKQTMQNTLSSNFQSMAKMMETEGYHVAYKGKWHMTKPSVYVNNTDRKEGESDPLDQLYWTPADDEHLANKWRFNDWNYPDAGDDMSLFNFGGGSINNDGRFVDGNGQSAWYGERIPLKDREEASAVHFLDTYKEKHGDKPLFLVVSLVNPHDVLSYPGLVIGSDDKEPLYRQGGYKDEDFDTIDVELPLTLNEDLDTKPMVQTKWKEVCQLNGPIQTEEKAKKYLQFYAYLTSQVDKEINKVLDAIDRNKMTNDSLIVRVSDHGDMAMSHGMQRQKMYNVYRETLNVPMIFSNPILFPEAKETESLSGLIDLMPTLASLVGIREPKMNFQGVDLTPIFDEPAKDVQEYIHFTYDDTYLTSPDPKNMGPSHIRCILSKEWKYAVYFDPNYGQKEQYEMYDLINDPLEIRNLAHEKYSKGHEAHRQFLHQKLTEIMVEKGTMPDSIIWPKVSGVDILGTQEDPAIRK